MRTAHRNYSEEIGDFLRLARFFTEHPADRRQTHTTWCLGRLVDWKYARYENKRAFASFCEENAHLWFDAFGELAGFVVSESGDAGFSILTLDGYRFLYEEMLNWVLEAWKARTTKESHFSTEFTEYQGWEMKTAERYGFHVESQFFTRWFDLTKDLLPRLPLAPGFTIVDMGSHPDVRVKAAQLEVPVYFLLGRHDVNAPPVLAEDYLELLDAPHKELIWFERSGHNPWVTEPAAFVDVIANKVVADTYPNK